MAVATVRKSCEADFTLRLADLPAEELKVVAFEAREAISGLFCLDVRLSAAELTLDPETGIGQACTLEVAGERGTRHFNGIVRHFERSGDGSRQVHYAVQIVPVHWLLTRRARSRIFCEQRCGDMSVPGIVRKVFEDGGLPQGSYRFALQRDYAPREFVVQYRESDFDFVSRLLEEEGIFYFFEHTADGHCMVLGDSRVAHEPVCDDAEFPFRSPSGLVAEQEHVFRYRDRREIRHGAVRLDDFCFKTPRQDLMVAARADAFTALEFSDYPGEYAEKRNGQRYAQTRLEELQCARHVVRMSATARALRAGGTFQLREHPDETANREYLITQLTHRGRQPQSGEEEAGIVEDGGYEVDVVAIPAEVAFRPPRVTPRPVVRGSQTAIVVGPEGEEIHTDEYGRVRVQFHWDHEGGYDEHSSCWIRVSQGLAGGGYGMMFLPRVGQEVIVDFLEGDPDRPIITGRVYNNDEMPPYKLPADKTRSTIKTSSTKGGGGSNEIRFEDRKGEEQVLLHAQKDLHVRARNDGVETIERDRHLTVQRDRVERVRRDHSECVGGDRAEQVGGDASLAVKGMVSVQVDRTHSTTIRGDVVEQFQANHKHDVSMTYAVKGMNICIEAGAGLELKCGASSIVLTPTAIFIKGGPLVNINSGSGPPVAPVSAQATSTAAAATPLEADKVDFGKDARYTATPLNGNALTVASLNGNDAARDSKKKTSWIEIQMLDEADQPVAGERYELKLPDGRLRRGSLDATGLARVEGIQPGSCEICFPNIDAAAWERI